MRNGLQTVLTFLVRVENIEDYKLANIPTELFDLSDSVFCAPFSVENLVYPSMNHIVPDSLPRTARG
jgi:hypothetical protein